MPTIGDTYKANQKGHALYVVRAMDGFEVRIPISVRGRKATLVLKKRFQELQQAQTEADLLAHNYLEDANKCTCDKPPNWSRVRA